MHVKRSSRKDFTLSAASFSKALRSLGVFPRTLGAVTSNASSAFSSCMKEIMMSMSEARSGVSQILSADVFSAFGGDVFSSALLWLLLLLMLSFGCLFSSGDFASCGFLSFGGVASDFFVPGLLPVLLLLLLLLLFGVSSALCTLLSAELLLSLLLLSSFGSSDKRRGSVSCSSMDSRQRLEFNLLSVLAAPLDAFVATATRASAAETSDLSSPNFAVAASTRASAATSARTIGASSAFADAISASSRFTCSLFSSSFERNLPCASSIAS
mmetsp:Transcript_53192/g.113653  ORF Transcript_53192/g.113653 Transcript_53192/m.113653 type:complete len:270 (-) Transcript_53192:108-917(-)